MKNLKHLSVTLLFFTFISTAVLCAIHSDALAASCTADCGNGSFVTCEGYDCAAWQGLGCQARDKGGKKRAEANCFH